MAYSEFTLLKVIKQFALQTKRSNLFPGLTPVPSLPSWLADSLERGGPLALLTEKSRSELIVTPILLATRELSGNQVAYFSGERFTVDQEEGLDGECDFIIVASRPEQGVIPILQSPLLCMVEAKKNDVEAGLGQCAAQMVAALRYNAQDEVEIERVFGCVTTGEAWQFLCLDSNNTLTIDSVRYYLDNLPLVIAALLASCQK